MGSEPRSAFETGFHDPCGPDYERHVPRTYERHVPRTYERQVLTDLPAFYHPVASSAADGSLEHGDPRRLLLVLGRVEHLVPPVHDPGRLAQRGDPLGQSLLLDAVYRLRPLEVELFSP